MASTSCSRSRPTTAPRGRRRSRPTATSPGTTSRSSRSATTAGRLHHLQRPDGRRPVGRPVARLRATWTQTQARRQRPLLSSPSTPTSPPTARSTSPRPSILYGGGGNKGTTPTGAIEEHVFVSTRQAGRLAPTGSSRTVQPGIACVAAGCPPDFYLGHTALSRRRGRQGRAALRRRDDRRRAPDDLGQASTDKGANWSAAVSRSPRPARRRPTRRSRPARRGDFRAWYMQTTGGGNVDAWNVWYRSSTDGGATWTARRQDLGRDERRRVQDRGRLRRALRRLRRDGDHARPARPSPIWGEGTSYAGPGGVWFNRQP